MTPWSGEPSSLYVTWPQTLYKGSQGTLPRDHLHNLQTPEALIRAVHLLALALLPLPPFLHPHCKNLRAFKRETHTQSSLRLDVGLQPEPYNSSCLLDATIIFLEQRGIHINLLASLQNTDNTPYCEVWT
jgi:hypothetical protein